MGIIKRIDPRKMPRVGKVGRPSNPRINELDGLIRLNKEIGNTVFYVELLDDEKEKPHLFRSRVHSASRRCAIRVRATVANGRGNIVVLEA